MNPIVSAFVWLCGTLAAVAIAWQGASFVDAQIIAPAAANHTECVVSTECADEGSGAAATLSALGQASTVVADIVATSTSAAEVPAVSTPMPTDADSTTASTLAETTSTTRVRPRTTQTTGSTAAPTTTQAATTTTAASTTVTTTEAPAVTGSSPTTATTPRPTVTTAAPATTTTTRQRITTTTTRPTTTRRATTSTTTSTTQPSTTTQAPTSTTSSPSTTQPQQEAEIIAFRLTGGNVTVSFHPSRIEVLWASAADGFSVDVDADRVEFRSNRHRSRIDLWWSSGPKWTIDERSDNHAGPSTSQPDSLVGDSGDSNDD